MLDWYHSQKLGSLPLATLACRSAGNDNDGGSCPLHELVDHLFLAGFVEIDGEFVAFDVGDAAVAEFLVEDALNSKRDCSSCACSCFIAPEIRETSDYTFDRSR